MRCPKCGCEFTKYVIKCNNCNNSFKNSSYLNSILEEWDNKLKYIEPLTSDSAEIHFKNINMDMDMDLINEGMSPEFIAINYYKQKGYNAFFAENNYWLLLFLLIYFKYRLWSHDFYLSVIYGNFNNIIFNIECEKKDYNKILNLNLKDYIIDAYFDVLSSAYDFGEVNDIFNDGKSLLFSIDELLSSVCRLNKEQFKLIFERMASDLKYYSKGFPDLIVYNDEKFFFVEVKSKDDTPSLKQIQWHKFLSEVVKIDIIILGIDKSEKQMKFIKGLYESSSNFSRNEEKPNKPICHLNDVILIPRRMNEYDCLNRRYKFITYDIKHSSGKGKTKQYLQTIVDIFDEKTKRWNYGHEDDEFLELMQKKVSVYQNIIINDKYTRLKPKDYGGREQYNKLRKKRSKIRDSFLFEKAKKLYYPNVFADYRPTKKQLERNKEAKLFEEQGNYIKAVELYEKNVSEKTGSPTTYKNLIKIYSQSGDYFRIKEVLNIAIPIFIYLNDKDNTVFFLRSKFDLIYKKNVKYHKLVTKEENDYLYENCCVDNAHKLYVEKKRELESKANMDYNS